MGGTSKVLLGAIVAGMMSIDMGGPFNKAAYVFGTAALPPATTRSWLLSWWAAWFLPSRFALSTHLLPQEVDP